MSATGSLEWKFGQVFGEKSPVDEVTECILFLLFPLVFSFSFSLFLFLFKVDIVSAIEFDTTGQFIAAGDRGGRVVIFERSEENNKTEYLFYCEFQSHEPEFDYLKSLEIEEKINQIKWLKPQRDGLFLLTTNDKTIKLWKVHKKQQKTITPSSSSSQGGLRLPRVTSETTHVTAVPRKVFANAHAYHINSISVNTDGQTYISADDLRI